MKEYECHEPALLVCQIERVRQLADNVIALPWQNVISYLSEYLDREF